MKIDKKDITIMILAAISMFLLLSNIGFMLIEEDYELMIEEYSDIAEECLDGFNECINEWEICLYACGDCEIQETNILYQEVVQ